MCVVENEFSSVCEVIDFDSQVDVDVDHRLLLIPESPL